MGEHLEQALPSTYVSPPVPISGKVDKRTRTTAVTWLYSYSRGAMVLDSGNLFTKSKQTLEFTFEEKCLFETSKNKNLAKQCTITSEYY